MEKIKVMGCLRERETLRLCYLPPVQLPITNFYALRALFAPSAFGTFAIDKNHLDIAAQVQMLFADSKRRKK